MIDAIGNIGALLLLGGILAMAACFVWENLFDYAGYAIASLLLGCVLMIPAIAESDNKRQTAFMDSCLKDRKDYECTAMWRSGNAHTYVAPVPVVVSGGRR